MPDITQLAIVTPITTDTLVGVKDGNVKRFEIDDLPLSTAAATSPSFAGTISLDGQVLAIADVPHGSYFFGRAGNTLDTSSGCTGVGDLALASVTTGVDHTAVGSSALQYVTGGVGNTAVGRLSQAAVLHTGANNTSVGDSTLSANTTANLNTAIGYSAMTSTTTGGNNTGLGAAALRQNLTGTDNTAIGRDSMRTGTAGSSNVAVGSLSLYTCNASEGTSVGFTSLYQATGAGNTALGAYAGYSVTTGLRNTFIGYSAGNDASQSATAERSIVIGQSAYSTKSDQCVLGAATIVETLIRGVSIHTAYTVATLPAAGVGYTAARAFVTDANATTFASVVAGGGANGVPVYCDGTNWRIG